MCIRDSDWEYSGRKLSIVAAMDVATTDAASKHARRADYTAIAVVGQCSEGYYYVLDLDLFKTDKRDIYGDKLIELYKKWRFRRTYVETEAAGRLVAQGLKDYVREFGYSLIIEGHTAPRNMSKQERHASILLPKYEQGLVYHTEGGYTDMLEDQIQQPRPAHDDAKDAVTIAIENSQRPSDRSMYARMVGGGTVVKAHNRFGGRAAR